MAMETVAYRGDWDQFRSSLTEDVLFAVGSVSEVTGPQAVADYYRKTQTGDHQITCADIRGSWELDNVVIIEMDVHARRAGDGKTVSYPSVGTFRFRGDKVHKWRTYPVYPSFIKDDRQF
jgi:limonene-1,2-epoxide hydrolase